MKKKRILILIISLKQCFVEKKKQGDKSICKNFVKLLHFVKLCAISFSSSWKASTCHTWRN
jgi:hypothetical protein